MGVRGLRVQGLTRLAGLGGPKLKGLRILRGFDSAVPLRGHDVERAAHRGRV